MNPTRQVETGNRRRCSAWLALALAVALGGAAGADTVDLVPRPREAGHLHNFYQLSETVYSGSQPEGDEDFAALQRLGIKTVLSVDGALPDAARAARFGLRYIHLPVGYDGITATNIARLVRVAEVIPGPLYVHCHHGQHRGPTAAALICQATAGWSTNEAVAWLHLAGTSADYPGLFRANVQFQMPDRATLERVPTNFPSRATVSHLVDTMVDLGRHWEALKVGPSAASPVPASPADRVPSTEATLIREAFRELQRTTEAQARGARFVHALAEAEQLAARLEHELKPETTPPAATPPAAGDSALASLGRSCVACHREFRQ